MFKRNLRLSPESDIQNEKKRLLRNIENSSISKFEKEEAKTQVEHIMQELQSATPQPRTHFTFEQVSQGDEYKIKIGYGPENKSLWSKLRNIIGSWNAKT